MSFYASISHGALVQERPCVSFIPPQKAYPPGINSEPEEDGYTIQLEKHHFKAEEAGDHLVITARIHGNEPSGEVAARRVIAEIQSGHIKLARGQLTIFPLLNPLAKQANVRGIWVDTNRDIHPNSHGPTPEHQIRKAIVAEFKKLKNFFGFRNWHLLDLHSVPLAGKAHVIVSDQPQGGYSLTKKGFLVLACRATKEKNFAQSLGTDTIYERWRHAWHAAEAPDVTALGHTQKSFRGFTSALIHAGLEFGAETSVCLESGQDDDPQSVEVAYNAIRNALQFHGLTDEPALPFPPTTQPEIIRFEKVLVRRDESEQLVGITHDAQRLEPGQVVLRGATREVTVPNEKADWLIAHPIPSANVGRHFGFLARKIA